MGGKNENGRVASLESELINLILNIHLFSGHRSCIGESLARMELFLFIGAIVQNFKISAPPGEDLSLGNMDKFGLLHTPKTFSILASPRGKLPF